MILQSHSLSDAIKVPTNPFPGLRPFEFEESHLFFGRDSQVEKLVDKLRAPRFVAVVGTSGSGKSSLVRAGLLPALLGGVMTEAGTKWRLAVMRPGNDPIHALATAVNEPRVFGSDDPQNVAIQIAVAEATFRRGSRGLVEVVQQNGLPSNENVLVVVDQFEELFRFAREAARKAKEEGERYQNDAAAFVKLLLEARAQRDVNIYVVLTMRSDFLGQCATFWDLPEAVNESQYLIPRLTRDQLRETIIGPIGLAGGDITPRLLTQLLNDIGADQKQDQLPVLQHLLMRVWNESKELVLDVIEGERRIPHRDLHKGSSVDICCYDAVGGMSAALSRHADEAYDELPDERHRLVAEKLFKALTEKGVDNLEIRRPTTVQEICDIAIASQAEVVTVIEAFRQPGRSFVMPPQDVPLTNESLIDISHESLIRRWARLDEWTKEEATSARIYRRLAETAVLEAEGGAGLWRDPDLQIALAWRQNAKPNNVWAQRYHREFDLAMKFLDRSLDERSSEVHSKELQRKKAIRRTRLMATIFAFLFLLSFVALVFANQQRLKVNDLLAQANAAKTDAISKRHEAEKQTLLAEANSVEAAKARKAADTARDAAEAAFKRAVLATKQAEQAAALARKANQNLQQANKQRETAEERERLNSEGLAALQQGQLDIARSKFMELIQKGLNQIWTDYYLGEISRKQGLYYNAETFYDEMLVRVQDPGHERDLIAVLNARGQLYREQRNVDRAEGEYKKLLDVYNRIKPTDYELLFKANIYADLGDLYREQNRSEKAETPYQEALKTWNVIQSSGMDASARDRDILSRSMAVAARYKSMAQFFGEQQKYPIAIDLYKRARAIWERNPTIGDTNSSFVKARDLEEMADLFRAGARFTNAESEKLTEPEKSRSLADAEKYYRDAEKYYLEALEATRDPEGEIPDSSRTAAVYTNLAEFYQELKKESESARYNSLAANALRKALDTVAPVTTDPVSADAVETLLPEFGVGYVTNNRGTDGEFQYGRAETIRAIIKLGVEWQRQHSTTPFSVGQISKKGGGPFPPYRTHQDGRELSIRPMRKDGANAPVAISSVDYSPELTRELVILLKQLYPSAVVYFNDPGLVAAGLTKFVLGTDNHLSVLIP